MGIRSSCDFNNNTCCNSNVYDNNTFGGIRRGIRKSRNESNNKCQDDEDDDKGDENVKNIPKTPVVFIDNISYHNAQVITLEKDEETTYVTIEIFDYTSYFNYYQNNNLFQYRQWFSKEDLLFLNNKFIYCIAFWIRLNNLEFLWSYLDLTRFIIRQFLDFFVRANSKTSEYDQFSHFTIHNLQPDYLYFIRLKTINDLKPNEESDWSQMVSFRTLRFDIKEWENRLFDISLCVSNIDTETINKMWNHFDTKNILQLDTNRYLWRYIYCFIAYYIRSGNRKGCIPKAKLLKPLLDDLSYGIRQQLPKDQQLSMTKDHFINNIKQYFTNVATQ